MTSYYMFQNGRILLLPDGSHVPETTLGLETYFLNSGSVDREKQDSDIWAELDPSAEIPTGFALFERRGAWMTIGEEKFFRMAKAFHLTDWQRARKYCGVCGGKTHFDTKEFAMKCGECGELFFPVICPAVIVAVEKEGKLLMGHGVNFPKGRYSVLAGFTEPGENLEDCVRREIYEESHIKVKNIKYFGSQPWAFPHSLMLGFTAEWESGEIIPQKEELTDVRWFAPDEIPDYYRGISISAKLIEDFAARMRQNSK